LIRSCAAIICAVGSPLPSPDSPSSALCDGLPIWSLAAHAAMYGCHWPMIMGRKRKARFLRAIAFRGFSIQGRSRRQFREGMRRQCLHLQPLPGRRKIFTRHSLNCCMKTASCRRVAIKGFRSIFGGSHRPRLESDLIVPHSGPATAHATVTTGEAAGPLFRVCWASSWGLCSSEVAPSPPVICDAVAHPVIRSRILAAAVGWTPTALSPSHPRTFFVDQTVGLYRTYAFA
jgi:hypothetical protein